MKRNVQPWTLPWLAVVLYPAFLLAFDGAINGYHQSGGLAMAGGALLAMLLAASVTPLALRALLITRNDAGPALVRGILYLTVGAPSLFSLTNTLSWLVKLSQPVFISLWIGVWLTVGLLLYLCRQRIDDGEQKPPVGWLRVVHGVSALVLLTGFLLAHLGNNSLAAWSVELHKAVQTTLRTWYRSELIEPVLLTLMLIMIATGVPMVARYSRQRLDAFRVVQIATGAYVGIFICSHVVAVLNGRRLGIETDWFFASGPNTLLDGSSLLGRLIPHYVFGTLCLIVHLGCGLRIVLLKHGVPQALSNRALYAVASVGMVVTIMITSALLGFHIEAPG
ncbi:MAG: hypothetical protein ABW171_15325 [Steroidobacter sp.]